MLHRFWRRQHISVHSHSVDHLKIILRCNERLAGDMRAVVSREFRQSLRHSMHSICEAVSGRLPGRLAIDSLEVDLGTFSAGNFDRELRDRFLQGFRDALAKLVPARSPVHAFERILQTGSMPDPEVWGEDGNPRTWLQKRLQENPAAWQSFLRETGHDPVALQRLAAIADDATMAAIREGIGQESKVATPPNLDGMDSDGTTTEAKRLLINLIDKPAAKTNPVLDEPGGNASRPDALAGEAVGEPIAQQNAARRGKQPQAGSNIRAPLDRHTSADPGSIHARYKPAHRKENIVPAAHVLPGAADTIGISNAGIILLWPLLPGLLKRAGLVEEQAFVDEPARWDAVWLLDEMIWGNDTEPTYERTLFTRLFCGFPATLSTEQCAAWDDAPWHPPAETAREAAQRCLDQARPLLLRSAKVTAEDFAAMFLRRGGALSYVGGDWVVTVDPDPSDILLGPPPWPLSQVHLPWLGAPIAVDWSLGSLPTTSPAAPPGGETGKGGGRA